MAVDLDHLLQWIGKTESRTDYLAPFHANALAATLDRPDPEYTQGAPLPPMWHLLYCTATPANSNLGYDGHAKLGGFMPPVPLPRRMWAGGRITFNRPLILGAKVARKATILKVSHKLGRTGPLVFVTVRFDFCDDQGVALTEERDIVYRTPQTPGQTDNIPQSAPTHATWTRTIHPDPVLLFRYSALTFNGHRIHYDHPFATKTEGYPGLVVHGPLIATLLVDLIRRNAPAETLKTFTFRAQRPIFDTADFTLNASPNADGKIIRLWAADNAGALAMDATATLA